MRVFIDNTSRCRSPGSSSDVSTVTQVIKKVCARQSLKLLCTRKNYINISVYYYSLSFQGPMNHFLSWRVWIPFRKLTYCTYLTHYVFIQSSIAMTRTAGTLTQMNIVSKKNKNI